MKRKEGKTVMKVERGVGGEGGGGGVGGGAIKRENGVWWTGRGSEGGGGSPRGGSAGPHLLAGLSQVLPGFLGGRHTALPECPPGQQMR